MNNIHNWLQRNCDTKLQVQQRRIKRSKCDRTTFKGGCSRIFAMIIGQPKLILCSLILLSSAPAYSQINPDNTLGAESSRLTPNVLINGANADRIDGGALRSSNLFHSFSEFNINNGQRVYFGNPAGVQNILTRVTGGQGSNILGTLGVLGNANLFLINPNGILFGQNARLDVRGSFVGTTANGVKFGEQGAFTATNPQAAPLLSVNPSALFFNQLNQGKITVKSQTYLGISPTGRIAAGLSVPDGKSLLLVGGNVDLDGGRLNAYGGRVELTGLAAPGTIGLNAAGNTLSLSVPEQVQRANVTLKNLSGINVVGAGGGDIAINAQNLEISNSFLLSGVGTGGSNPTTQAGDITLNATESIFFKDNSVVDNSVYSNVAPGIVSNGGNINIIANSVDLTNNSQLVTGIAAANGNLPSEHGNAGNIDIKTGSLSLSNGAFLASGTLGKGDAGNISIDARDAISFNSAYATSFVFSNAVGKGGDIQVNAKALFFRNNGRLITSTLGQGNAGDITINALDTVSLDGINLFGESSRVASTVESTGIGNGGNIQITTGSLSLTNSGLLGTVTNGKGNAGDIEINALDTVSINAINRSGTPSRAISTVEPTGIGNGGNIKITTGSLSLTNSGQIAASTSGKGNAGNITIDARAAISFDSGYATSSVFSNAVGKGGDIRVNAKALLLRNNGQLNTSTFGQGNAGDIEINALDTVSIDGGINFFGQSSKVASTVESTGIGNGGNIRVTTGSLSLTNGGQLGATTRGQGNAGNITIDALDTVNIEGVANYGIFINDIFSNGVPSTVASTVESKGNGNGGNIRVTARSLSVSKGGQLGATTSGEGNAGNITIDAHDSVSIDGTNNSSKYSSFVISGVDSTGIGNGGNVEITTNYLSLTNGGQIGSNTFGIGNGGDVTINVHDTVSIDGVNNRSWSGVGSQVGSYKAIGNAGNIRVTTRYLSLNKGGVLSTCTFGNGNAGDIIINAHDAVNIDGMSYRIIDGGISSTLNNELRSGVASSVESGGVGNGGNIIVTTGSLFLSKGGMLNATTHGKGDAGDIIINAHDTVNIDGNSNNTFPSSGATTGVELLGIGNGGNIKITTGSLFVTRGGQIGSNTRGQGNAGDIIIDARDTVRFDGFINTTPSGVGSTVDFIGIGNGGNIRVKTGSLFLTNSGTIATYAAGQGNAGNIFIESNNLTIDNEAGISAQTGSTQGGNIDLQLADLLLLRRKSMISTTAGLAQAGGDGGNITINSPFIIAVPNENSDITANAFSGKGGNVNITTQGIFGIEVRPQFTPFSDITASSELGVQGNITISEPEVQPPQKLLELPTGLVDASSQIAQTCPRGPNAKPLSNFVVTGRGSLPPTSLEPLAATTSLSPLASLDGENAVTKVDAGTRGHKDAGSSSQIVEAQGLVKTADGNIMLVAQAPNATPVATSSSAMCPVAQ